MQRLSGLDAFFLYSETPNVHMHVGSIALFDPSTVEGGYSYERMRDTIAARLHEIPAFRQRLVTVPFNVHHPLWLNDPDFDLDYHLRRAALPQPGGLRQLADFAADVLSRPLDRSRPLWEMWLIEGVEGGDVAALSKIHHAAVDGISGREIATTLLDMEPQTEVTPPEEPFEPEHVPSDLSVLARAVAERALQPRQLVETAYRTARAAARLGAREFQRRSDGEERDGGPPPVPFTAPRTPFNASITPHRRIELLPLPLDDVKQVKGALGVTFNDVVLAVCGGAVRRYLAERGELPDDPMVAWVPISVREDGDGHGNAVSAMLTSLATDIDDPVDRLHRTASSARSGKRQHVTIGATTLTDWTEFAAPALFSRAARLYSSTGMAEHHQPLYNVVVSNIPGPPRELFFAGARLDGFYAMGPVIDGGALNITAMSYRDEIFFAFVACREAVPDLAQLAGHLEQSLAELLEAAQAEETSG